MSSPQSSQPDDFLPVATMAQLEGAGGALKVIVNGRGVALFTAPDGAIHAVQNACPHRGAPMTLGRVVPMTEGLFVVCGDHAWRFRLSDGVCPEAGPECSLLVWDVKVDEGGQIRVSRLPRISP